MSSERDTQLKKTAETIEQILDEQDLSIVELIELLSNIGISQSLHYFPSVQLNSFDEIMDFCLEDIKKNGETIQNSMLKQYLLNIMWLKINNN